MKVNLAAQVMSSSVTAAFNALVTTGYMDSRCQSTAAFVKEVDSLFKSFDCVVNNRDHHKVLRCRLSSKTVIRIMDKIDTSAAIPKYAESGWLEPKNGITMLPCSVNSVFQFDPKNSDQLHELICNTEQVKNISELIVSHTDLQTLPDIFTLNFENLTHLNLEDNRLSHLPLKMKNLMKLQHLNLSHNCLEVLSDEIGNLNALQTLKLQNNNLFELPGSVCNLMNLQQLSVANNNLRILPNDIGELVKLEKLDISGNMLEDLPGSVLQLANLCHFSAASNKLSYLSESFTHLNKLRTLNLSKNLLYEVPYCLFIGLPNISVLDLSHNFIDSFSEAPNCASKLRILKLDHNSLLTIPRWIFQDACKCLLQLDISYNTCMNGISIEVFMSASNLKRLDISNCRLTTTNVVFLRGLRSLEYLNMGNSDDFNKVGNIFWDLPMSDLKNSCSLQSLTLCSVGLAAVPDDIIQLSRLQHLDLSSNYLTWLPDAFSGLVHLKSCRLSNNGLALLPAQLGKLQALKELSLDDNKLHSLPESMVNLKQLELLDLYSNTFEEVPEILENMLNLKALDLEYNCFDVFESLKNDNFLDRYVHMKCNMRSQLTGFSTQRRDCKRPRADCDACFSSDDTRSSSCGEETEKESIPDGNHNSSVIGEEEQEDWDNTDEVSDNFDPTFLPPSAQKEVCHRQALLVMESLISSPDSFCPADIHAPPVKSQCRSKYVLPLSAKVVEGQFDDVSPGE